MNTQLEKDGALCWRSREQLESAVGVFLKYSTSIIMYEFVDTYILRLKIHLHEQFPFQNYSENIMLHLYTKQGLKVVANNRISEIFGALF